MQSKKETILNFEKLLIAGQIQNAFDTYASHDFVHHNPYCKGDKNSLIKAMEENALQFPNKAYEIKNILEDGDFVTSHARLKLNPEMPEFSVVHIYRFEGTKIVEEWDVAQAAPKHTINERGLF